MANVPINNIADTWNSSGMTFTGIKFNVTDTASAAGSLLMDLQVGGVSKFGVNKSGSINALELRVSSDAASGAVRVEGNSVFMGYTGNGPKRMGMVDASTFGINAQAVLGWSGNNIDCSTGLDVKLYRDAANTLAQRNGANAQEFRIYNTYPDASNTEYARLKWDTNVLKIGTFKTGTGTARALEFHIDTRTQISLPANGRQVRVYASHNVLDQSIGLIVGPPGGYNNDSAQLVLSNDNDSAHAIFRLLGRGASASFLGGTDVGGACQIYPAAGKLAIGTYANYDFVFGTNNVERGRFKTTGQFKLVPQATPATAEAGDIYYDSTANKLKVYTGSAWETITSA